MKLSPIIFILFFFSQCELSHSKKAIALNDQGLKYLQEGNESEAIRSFKKALEIKGVTNQDRSAILRNIGIANNQAFQTDSIIYFDRTDSAKYYFLQAAALNEDTSYLYLVNIAEVHLIDKKIKKATGCLEYAWRIDSNSVAVNNLLGLIYLGEHGSQYLDAAKALKYNLKLNKHNRNRITRSNLAKNYYLLKDYEKAEKGFQELLDQYPQFPGYLISIIMINKDQGKTDKEKMNVELLKQKYPKAYQNYIGWKNLSPGN